VRLDVHGLTDRLVSPIVGKVLAQPARDLLGAVPLLQALQDFGEPNRVVPQLARSGARPRRVDGLLGDPEPIPQLVTPRHLPVNGRLMPPR
jgi:hypothetical protein